MPEHLAPESAEELADALRELGERQVALETGGAFSKRAAGGPVAASDCRLTTARLSRLLAYEPADLTISVGAGMPLRELSRVLAESNQFLPLDAPFSDCATVGGAVATNSSGYRRRRYGTARDMVIGMQFATMDGKLVRSGGMVVKNVTGLDMGKLMIGSFGTLAVLESVNFKVFPAPEATASFQFRSPSVATLLEFRRDLLRSVLQPTAMDWADPAAAAAAGLERSHALLVETSGTEAVTVRFEQAYADLASRRGVQVEPMSQEAWEAVRETGPAWLQAHPQGAVVKVSTVHARLGEVIEAAGDCGCGALLRAGSAVGIALAPDGEAARRMLEALRGKGMRAVLEAASDEVKAAVTQWDVAGPELDVMRKIKADFDPGGLLNRGRLYGVI